MAGLRLPGTAPRRKPSISPARAAAFRVLARCDSVVHASRHRGSVAQETLADGSVACDHTISAQTLDSLVRRDLATVEVLHRARRYRLTAYGRALAERVDLSNARRDEALAAEMDAAMAERRAS
jgi:hypothetical protein